MSTALLQRSPYKAKRAKLNHINCSLIAHVAHFGRTWFIDKALEVKTEIISQAETKWFAVFSTCRDCQYGAVSVPLKRSQVHPDRGGTGKVWGACICC